MSFRIELNKYDEAYGHFMREIRSAIQETFAQEAESRNLTRSDLAKELKVDPSVVSRRLSGSGNVTLRTVCDFYTAMGRAPLSNFLVRGIWAHQNTENWSMNISNNGDQIVVIANLLSEQPDPELTNNVAVWQVKNVHGPLHPTPDVNQKSVCASARVNSRRGNLTAFINQDTDYA